VNAAMIAKMNTLPLVTFPKDGGLRAGERVGAVDFVAEGGDIANRQEMAESGPIEPAAKSWAQFKADYIDGLHLFNRTGARTPVYIVPGNHDVSNAIGFYRWMAPPIDTTSMVEIYNRMMAPTSLRTASTYDYPSDKVLFSHDFGGIHFVFITMWPDSAVRAWMERDLDRISLSTPAIVFAHDQPESEAKHFTNPNGKHDINGIDKFENLLVDVLADGTSVDASTEVEQRALQSFIAHHTNVTAYFHGNSNWNEFYDWTGPDHGVVLHTFRVDSPMKGAISSRDETKLSFQVVTIDTESRRMTVRECLWNAYPQYPSVPVAWGGSTTVVLYPRPRVPG
jgi:Calcineurin-like phosphoesterase